MHVVSIDAGNILNLTSTLLITHIYTVRPLIPRNADSANNDREITHDQSIFVTRIKGLMHSNIIPPLTPH